MIREESFPLGMTEHTALVPPITSRCKGMIEIEDIQTERDIIRNSTANLKDRVKALIEKIRKLLVESLKLDRQQVAEILEKDMQLLDDWLEINGQQVAEIEQDVQLLDDWLEINRQQVAEIEQDVQLLNDWPETNRRHVSVYKMLRYSYNDICLYSEPEFTPKEIRYKNQILKEEVTSSQYDYFGRQTARIIHDVNAVTDEIRPMNQGANETVTSSRNVFSKRPTASIKDGMMLLQDEIRGNDQIADVNRIAKQKICIEETAERIIDVVNDLADEIRCKGMIEIQDIQTELDIIRKSTANIKDTVKALIEEMRQEHHRDDGDIAEELRYIQWLIAELMGALKRLKTAIRENQLDLQPFGIKRKLNIVVIKREVSGDDVLQRLKKTKHIATYDLAGEKRPTYGNLSTVLCELCINENEAVNWCETCNSNICVSCTCFHKDVRMMMNHRIFNLP